MLSSVVQNTNNIMPRRRSSRSTEEEGGRRRDGGRTTSSSSSSSSSARNSNHNDNVVGEGQQEDAVPPPRPVAARGIDGNINYNINNNNMNNSVASHVRDRQRAIAEREATRLARPEQRRPKKTIGHADKRKSAVTSTPFGVFSKSSRTSNNNNDDDDDDDPQQTVAEEWCGPFSVARQMIKQREAAKRKREAELAEQQEDHHPLDALMEEVNMEQKRRAHPSMQWKSNVLLPTPSSTTATATTSNSMYAKRQKRIELSKGYSIDDGGSHRIPTLFQLCVNFVVQHFDYVESLGDVDNDVRLALSKELVGRNQLDGRALQALVNGSVHTIETLEVVDCAGISQDIMSSTLSDMSTLRYLLLTHAGRAFGKKSVTALVEKNTSARLCCIDIAGAYLLQDDDAANLIRAHSSTLRSVAFSTCPLLGEHFVNAIVDGSKGTKGNDGDGGGDGRLLELSLKDMTFPVEHLHTLTSSVQSKRALGTIKALTLQSLVGLTDDLLINILQTVGHSLDSLDVSNNYDLTDITLSSIRRYNPNIRTLVLNGLKDLTAAGLEALFTHPLPNLPPPPKLKVLQLSSIDHQAVTDELLRLVTAASSGNPSTATMMMTMDGPPFMDKNADDDHGETQIITMDDGDSQRRAASVTAAGCGGRSLVQLDIQGSTLVTDTSLEGLVDTSTNSLQVLNVSYCPLITDQGLGYLVSKMGKQLTKIQVWGCAQLTDDFFDGHDRIQDPTLEIIGAWMKKSGSRSLR